MIAPSAVSPQMPKISLSVSIGCVCGRGGGGGEGVKRRKRFSPRERSKDNIGRGTRKALF